MADLKLNDFKKSIENDYSSFNIDFGTEDKPRTVSIMSFAMAKPAAQVAFMSKFSKASVALDGEMSQALLEEFTGVKMGEDGEIPEGHTLESLTEAAFEGVTDAIRDALRSLAENKKDFDAFAKALDGGLVHWMAVASAYIAKYKLTTEDGVVDEEAVGK